MKFGPVLHSKVVYYYKTIINIGSQFEPVLNQFGIPAKIPNQELNRKPLSWTRTWTELNYQFGSVGSGSNCSSRTELWHHYDCYELVDLNYSYEVTSVTIFKSKSNDVEM